ncbi:MAG: cobalt ECF transporter T component CbiQ [Stomatobaculum sp.]|nr:cobalt ECF transporter T component CbiQ [Stomatobaculum sp.]
MNPGPEGSLRELQTLEELSSGNTAVHRLHPGAKLAAVLVYLVCLMSLERHSLSRVTPFLFYPVLMCAVSSLPPGLLFRRTLPALPFALFAGVSNLLFERGTALSLTLPFPGGAVLLLTVTQGMFSFAMLMCRTLLCVSAVMILIGTTPFPDLTGAMKQMHFPAVLADLLEMLYRYLFVLGEEAELMITAFRLRSGGRVWPVPSEYAPMISQLFFRSADRAERIYDSMQCRLSSGAGTLTGEIREWNSRDRLFLLLAWGSSVLFAFLDIPMLLETLAGG